MEWVTMSRLTTRMFGVSDAEMTVMSLQSWYAKLRLKLDSSIPLTKVLANVRASESDSAIVTCQCLRVVRFAKRRSSSVHFLEH